jgi:hypothetical protein
MDTELIKGFFGAVLITAVILVLGYFIVRDDAEKAMRPLYRPDGSCFMNCK